MCFRTYVPHESPMKMILAGPCVVARRVIYVISLLLLAGAFAACSRGVPESEGQQLFGSS